MMSLMLASYVFVMVYFQFIYQLVTYLGKHFWKGMARTGCQRHPTCVNGLKDKLYRFVLLEMIYGIRY